MVPVRKIFDNPLFPFALVYQDTKSPQSELPDHLHEWYEIVYVYRGKGTFFVDHTFYDMEQGDVFAIPGNTIHRAFPDKEDPVTSTAIFFNPAFIQNTPLGGDNFSFLQLFEQGISRKNYKYTLVPEHRPMLENHISNMHEEMAEPHVGYKNAVSLLLHMILLYLNRKSLHHQNEPNFLSGPLWMKEILIYIDQNFTENLRLDDLSGKASITPAHFSRVFKQLTGMNLTDYLTTKKLIKAKELLATTHDKTMNIAGQCGFESMPHFHRVFKKYFAMTPAVYRKSRL